MQRRWRSRPRCYPTPMPMRDSAAMAGVPRHVHARCTMHMRNVPMRDTGRSAVSRAWRTIPDARTMCEALMCNARFLMRDTRWVTRQYATRGALSVMINAHTQCADARCMMRDALMRGALTRDASILQTKTLFDELRVVHLRAARFADARCVTPMICAGARIAACRQTR